MKLKASPFAWVSFAMIVGVMGTALISPLYALYKEAWDLQASDISRIYVIYMGGALCTLLFLGRLPDRVGFRPVMMFGLGMAIIGTFISLIAWDVTSLSVGRLIVGVASSMVTTSATLGLAKLSPPGNVQRVAMMSGFLIALGFGVGPLVGGVVGQWAPYPLVTTYVPTLVLAALGMLALAKLELPANASPKDQQPLQWSDVLPKLTWPTGEASKAFALTSSLPFLAFGVFGLYASMSPLFLDKLVPWHGPAVSGTAIALILLMSACTQILAGRMPTHWCGALGLVSLALSNALLMINLWAGSATLFALGVLFTAAGHGMSMLAGMSMVNRIATPANRSGLLSTYLVIGYVGSMVPMLGIGWIADNWGMDVAVRTFCAIVIVLGSTAAVFFQRHPRMQPALLPA
ncbi:MFS transporter [Acidovorax sp. CCYZU-2555]|uniref:MFS transporter n=1 Tax=Acidovorax sp. CCYZU-2555 TaxID=2835042 RepID=UPI001BCC90DA|nr:MFS transporter [Acidovorax sp. CCYZU-2555]MBS7779897.1 MFS transporter [Acidovorax sp. CCYZU-2555]